MRREGSEKSFCQRQSSTCNPLAIVQRHRISGPVFSVITVVILIIAVASSAISAPLPRSSIQIGGAVIEVAFEDGELSVARASVLHWISKSACAVSEYYGRFPVEHLQVNVVPVEGRGGVGPGKTFIPDRLPIIRVIVGRFATASDLQEDWTMTHEMVHLAFPSVPQRHHWIEEGIATYVEPIAR